MTHGQTNDFNQSIKPYVKIILPELAEELGLKPEVKGNEMILLNPQRADSNTGSFSVNLDTGKYYDHAFTGHKGNNFESFISHISGKNIEEVIEGLKQRIETLSADDAEEAVFVLIEGEIAATSTPVEAGSILPPDIHPDLGRPTTCWKYVNEEGNVCFYIYRFDTEKGKEIRPLSYDGNRWQWKSSPDNRPLYNADLLAKHPDKQIIIVEGEKACDAASLMFPNYICMTSSGGSAALKKTNWKVLHGREIIIIPDNDDPGVKYRDAIIQNLHSHCDIQVVDTASRGWKKGDDLADHIMAIDKASQWLDDNIQFLNIVV